MRVPVAAPTRMQPQEAAAVQRAAAEVIAGTQWVLGDRVARFESEFAAYLGAAADSVVGVGNGTDALVVAMTALELPQGAGVLVAADEGGYAATAARIAGLVPVPIDAGAQGPTVETAEAGRTPDVAALVVTHLHGNAVPMSELDRWRRAHGLRLIEDCAQAHGLRVDGRHVGGTGDAATFSFYPTKNLGAVGDGGAAWFADPAVADHARALRQYGWGERFRVEHPRGRNSRLDPIQAAVLSARLPFLDERNARRRSIAARYAERVELLGDPAATVAHHAVVLADDRDGLARGLAERGVDSAVHYPWLVTEMPGLHVAPAATPGAQARRDRILSLPCFPELTDVEVDTVCAALDELVR
ncbi:dTDP-3-amino-2,3,6-trideoxy-4-keto-D-glucose/dTDP-3-amino-3,4,6-trideoxy-alpha-D-glucose/dTDP-2,6-dideoxy-D-kanosamine transaminase [Marmoricola sp. URHA0025 HA25]